MLLEQGEEAQGVGKDRRGGDDLEQVRLVTGEPGVDGLEIGRGVEVVPAEQEGGWAVAENVEFLRGCGLELFRGFQGEVDDGCTGDAAGVEDARFVAGGAGEVAAVRGAAAGGDGVDVWVLVEEGFEGREESCGAVKRIEAELEESAGWEQGLCGLEHGGAAEGDADAGEGGDEHCLMVERQRACGRARVGAQR